MPPSTALDAKSRCRWCARTRSRGSRSATKASGSIRPITSASSPDSNALHGRRTSGAWGWASTWLGRWCRRTAGPSRSSAPPARARRSTCGCRSPRPPGPPRLRKDGPDLPAVVREGLVRLRHLVRVLALLHRVAAVVRRVHQLGGELLVHGLLAALLGVLDQPAHGERHPALLPHFHGDLVGGTADAAALHLEDRLDVVEGLLERLDRVVVGALLDQIEGAVGDALGDGLLPLAHHVVDELGEQPVLELRIGEDSALGDVATTRHVLELSLRLRTAAWRRTCCGPACGRRRRRSRACRE